MLLQDDSEAGGGPGLGRDGRDPGDRLRPLPPAWGVPRQSRHQRPGQALAVHHGQRGPVCRPQQGQNTASWTNEWWVEVDLQVDSVFVFVTHVSYVAGFTSQLAITVTIFHIISVTRRHNLLRSKCLLFMHNTAQI